MTTKELKIKHIENYRQIKHLSFHLVDLIKVYDYMRSHTIYTGMNGKEYDLDELKKLYLTKYSNQLIAKYTNKIEVTNERYETEVEPNLDKMKLYKSKEKEYIYFANVEEQIRSLDYKSQNATKIISEEAHDLHEIYNYDRKNSYPKTPVIVNKQVPDEIERMKAKQEMHALIRSLNNNENYNGYKEEYSKLLNWEKIIKEKEFWEVSLYDTELEIVQDLLGGKYALINETIEELKNTMQQIQTFSQTEVNPVKQMLIAKNKNMFLNKYNCDSVITNGTFEKYNLYSLKNDKINAIKMLFDFVKKNSVVEDVKIKENFSKEEIIDYETKPKIRAYYDAETEQVLPENFDSNFRNKDDNRQDL